MAFDAHARRSLLTMGMPWLLGMMPVPDGALTVRDRQQFLGLPSTPVVSEVTPEPEPGPAVLYKVGTFIKNTSTGLQSVTGVGFKPKVVFLFTTGQTAFDQFDEGAEFADGVASASGSIATTGLADDNVSPADVHSIHANTSINDFIRRITAAGASLDVIRLSSLDDDGFTLSLPIASASAVRLAYLAIGGELWEDIHNFTTPASGTGNTSRTFGFPATSLMTWQVNTGPAVNTADTKRYPNRGLSDGTSHGLSAVATIDAANPSSTFRYQRTSKVAGMLNPATGAVLVEADFVDFTETGLVVNYSTRAGASMSCAYLTMGGLQCKVGSFRLRATAGLQTISGLGFRPGAIHFQTVGMAPAATPQAEDRFALGWTDGVTSVCAWQGAANGVNPTVAARTMRQNRVVLTATPNATAASSTIDNAADLDSFTDDGFVLDVVTADGTEPEILFIAWEGGEASGGGELPPGQNPPPGDPVGTVGVARFVIGGETVVCRGEATIRNPSTLWDGKIPSGLLTIAPHERVLAYDSVPRADCTIVVDDTPDPVTGECFWKTLAATATLEGAHVELSEHHAPYGITIGTPWVFYAGRVTRHRPSKDGFRYEFHLSDVVGELFHDPELQPEFPGRPLTVAELAGMDESFDGKFPPRILGRAVQDGEGVALMIPIGRLNPFAYWGHGVNQELGVGVICLGAVYDVLDGYVGVLTWEAEKAVFEGELRIPATPDGFYYRVTTAGTTGSEEPDPWAATTNDGTVVWTRVGPYDATQRHRIPDEMYGVAGGLVVPHKPGWSDITGFAFEYALGGDPERAWTLVFWDLSHPYSPYVEDGRLVLTWDVIGAMNSPTSGTPILDHVHGWAWTLLNLIWHNTDGKTYGNMPMLPGQTGEYSAIDMDAVDAAKAIGDAMGGFVLGLVLAPLGDGEDAFARLASFPRDGCFRVGINRFGQAFPARKNVAAPATVVFDEVKDHIEFEVFWSTERRGIGVEFQFAPRYLDPEPAPAAAPGQPSVRIGGRQPGPWASGLQRLPHAAAQAAQDASWGRERPRPIRLELDTTRDAATAQRIAEFRRDEGAGPGPAYHGIPMFRMKVPWDRWKRVGTDGRAVDLNTYCALTTSEGFGPTGYVLKKGWITKVAPDRDADVCVLEGEIIEEEDS